jgi:flagellar biosynthesis chaperone FliJ
MNDIEKLGNRFLKDLATVIKVATPETDEQIAALDRITNAYDVIRTCINELIESQEDVE